MDTTVRLRVAHLAIIISQSVQDKKLEAKLRKILNLQYYYRKMACFGRRKTKQKAFDRGYRKGREDMRAELEGTLK